MNQQDLMQMIAGAQGGRRQQEYVPLTKADPEAKLQERMDDFVEAIQEVLDYIKATPVEDLHTHHIYDAWENLHEFLIEKRVYNINVYSLDEAWIADAEAAMFNALLRCLNRDRAHIATMIDVASA